MGGSSNGSGLYQSDDTGKTWKHLGWRNIKCYSMDMVQSSNGRILYEATGLGVLRSTDYGEHWKQITDWRMSEVMDVAVNQKNPEEIYLATAHGAWRTRDGGRSWEYLNGINPHFGSRAMYSQDTLLPNALVIAGEGGIFWRNSSDTSWHSPKNGPTQVRDVKFKRIILHSTHDHIEIDKSGNPTPPSKEKTADMWIAASGKDGLFFSFKGIIGFAGNTTNRWSDTAATWCVEQQDDHRIWGGPDGVSDESFGGDVGMIAVDHTLKNVTTCLRVGDKNIIGTLDQGIDIWGAKPLPHRQLWTLKSFLVTP